MPAPVLTDGVVTLRPHTLADADDLTAMATDVDVIERTSVPVPYERRYAEQWITEQIPQGWERGTAFGWAIEVDGRYCGNVDIRRRDVPDIGYVLAPWARGKGSMSRAVRLAVRWAFDHADLPVVHWSTHVGNFASWRVAHACGFTFHGERPLSVPHRDGELRDGWFASLKPGDRTSPRTEWRTSPVLEHERVRLRPLRDGDVPRLAVMYDDPRSRRWLSRSGEDPFGEAEARAYVGSAELDQSLGRKVTWAIADPDDDRLLGDIALQQLDWPLDPTGAGIGYVTHPDARGRGVMSAALRAVVEHGFAPVSEGGLGRERLWLGASAENGASRVVAERAGFRLVGVDRHGYGMGQGPHTDGVTYDLLPSDPRP